MPVDSIPIEKAFKLKSGALLSAKKMIRGPYPVYGGNGNNGYHNDFKFEEPKLIIGRVGAYCGNVHLTAKNSWITDNALYISELYEEYDLNYLLYVLREANLGQYRSQAGQPLISAGRLATIQIPLPPLDEQKRIAAILDKADALRRKQQKALDLCDEFLKATFIDMFGDPITNSKGWATKKFQDIVKLQRGHDLPKNKRNSQGSIPVYGSNGILSNHNESKCVEGIVTGRSGSIGNVYYSKEPFWPLNTTLFSIETYDNNLMYLSHLLSHFKLERFSRGAGVPTLNRNLFHSELIYDIDINIQSKFAEIAKKTEAQKSKLQQSLDQLNENFNALSQRAFKGEL